MKVTNKTTINVKNLSLEVEITHEHECNSQHRSPVVGAPKTPAEPSLSDILSSVIDVVGKHVDAKDNTSKEKDTPTIEPTIEDTPAVEDTPTSEDTSFTWPKKRR